MKNITQPIFQPVLVESWDNLPPVMQAHYAVCPNSNDLVVAKGWLDVSMAWPLRPACRLTRMLVPYEGSRVPVTVSFTANGDCFCFDRAFAFPERPIYHFRSQMQPVGGNEVIEWMRYGLGWRCAYGWDGEKVILSHRGYVWRLLGTVLPVPLHWFIGKGYAEEHPLTDTTFSMWTHTKHPLFGELFRYGGEFGVQ